MPTLSDIHDALTAPFHADEVKFKPQAFHRESGRALALPHIDARAVAARLDAVAGPEHWSDRYHLLPGSAVAILCTLTICGVAKEGIGEARITGNPEEELYKSAESDALKRAATKFGIGRYLYALPKQYLPYDGKKFTADGITQPQAPRAEATPAALPTPNGPVLKGQLDTLAKMKGEVESIIGEACPIPPGLTMAAARALIDQWRRAIAFANEQDEPPPAKTLSKPMITVEQRAKIDELRVKLIDLGQTAAQHEGDLKSMFGVTRFDDLLKTQASRVIDDYRTVLNGLYLAKRREVSEETTPTFRGVR